MAKRKKSRSTPSEKARSPQDRFTATQGQYLAYLYLYRKLHRYAPAENEIAGYFGVSPPSAHQMAVKLEEKGLISREPGVPRSIRVLVPASLILELQATEEEEEPAGATRHVDDASHGPARIYRLEVFLIGGPLPGEFAGKRISRTIEIRGDQTLEELHRAIFKAFDRWDEHFYEFQFGKGPNDPDGKRYVLPEMLDEGEPEATIAGEVGKTTINSLGLEVDQPFGYWFDYGDDWWHQINVVATDEKISRKQYPAIVKRVGKSPPQYMEEEEE